MMVEVQRTNGKMECACPLLQPEADLGLNLRTGNVPAHCGCLCRSERASGWGSE